MKPTRPTLRATCLLAAVVAALGPASPAAANTQDRGYVQRLWYDNYNVYHELKTWIRVDYTLHRVRPYAYNYSGQYTYKGSYVDFYSNSGNIAAPSAYQQAYELAVTTSSTYACNGPHRWYNDASYQYYEGSNPIDEDLWSSPFDSAC